MKASTLLGALTLPLATHAAPGKAAWWNLYLGDTWGSHPAPGGVWIRKCPRFNSLGVEYVKWEKNAGGGESGPYVGVKCVVPNGQPMPDPPMEDTAWYRVKLAWGFYVQDQGYAYRPFIGFDEDVKTEEIPVCDDTEWDLTEIECWTRE